MLRSIVTGTFQVLIFGAVTVAHAPALLGRRDEIIRINERFRDALMEPERLLDIDIDLGPSRNETNIAVITGPTILSATSHIVEAIEEVGKALDDDVRSRLLGSVQEALDMIDREAVHVESLDDPLFEPAVERLRKQLGGEATGSA